VVRGTDPTLLLTVRSDEVRDHKGEVSFPGGVRHEEDPDLLTTALRETEEELGIPRTAFAMLGSLPPTHTVVTGYVIVPYVGVLPERPPMTPSPVEIAEVVEVEISRLDAVEREDGDDVDGGRTWFVYPLDGQVVWGATGRIVHAFLELWRQGG
jgi:8-oxo-dGTP pyrophosphatase MutT (NUDIX family)